MTVRVKERSADSRVTTIELEGELDLYAAAEVNTCLTEAVDDLCRRLVLDARPVTRLDFSLVAIFAYAGKVLGQRHATLEVICLDNEIGRLLAAAGERGFFDVTFVPPGEEPAAG